MEPTHPTDLDALVAMLREVTGGHAQLGMLGAIAASLTVLVRAVRLPLVQRALVASFGAKAAWDVWPKGAKLAFVFLLSTAGAVVTAFAVGSGLSLSVVVAGLAAGLGSIALNETSEAAGDAMAPATNKLPPAARAAVGLAFPVPRSLEELRVIERELEAKAKASKG
jgi:hypothetical protein